MFNLFKNKKVLKAVNSVKQAFAEPVDAKAVIEKIHADFDSSTERLLSEADRIINNNKDTEKGHRLKNIGFTSSKSAVEANVLEKKKIESEVLAAQIKYFQQWYPFNKFITKKEVESICKKYGLVFGDVEYFIGDVPEKNLFEIESFKLRQEDHIKYACGYYKHLSHYGMYPCDKEDVGSRYGCIMYSKGGGRFFMSVNEGEKDYYEKPTFKICASIKDFNTKYMTVSDGYKLEIDDPIVLQPVQGGYLIVSKWGLEASDEIVVNSIDN